MPWSLWKAANRAKTSSSDPARGGSRWRSFRSVRALSIVGGAALAAWPATALATPRPNWHPVTPWAPLNPASSEMRHISDLFWVMLGISGIVFIGVCAALVISIVRFSAKPNSPEPAQIFGNQRIELTWTIIPTVILLVAFIFTAESIHTINSPAKGTIMNIQVIGHQWWWEFRYPPQPSLGIPATVVTADELHLPTGIPIHFHITSADVIHSFWTPQLQRQVDANPGIDNAVYLELNQTGTYAGDCYEYCGEAHAWMKYKVMAQTPVAFHAWVNQQLKTASSTPSSALAAAGKKVFLSNTCISCHAVNGTLASGIVGPNLTHLASRWAIAGGAAPLDTKDLMAWIRDPSSYKPGVNM
ncbi:MAG TPA: cytochrome c oxidase subunit II, partial [Chloroflexota bacterium]